MSERAAQNRRYLLNRVIPHLEKMPTYEEYMKSDANRNELAIFNLDTYMRDNKGTSQPACEINEKYNCGREGCLAGWYVMLSERDERLTREERCPLEDFGSEQLSKHFGLPGDGFTEGRALFGGLGSGEEENIYAQPYQIKQKAALAARKARLKRIMTELGDITCERQESTSLTKL